MKKMFFLLMAMFCLISNAYGAEWDLESRVALGQFDAGKSKVTKGMEISLLSITGLTAEKMVQIEVRTDQVGQVAQNQQLAEERGQAVLEMLQKLVPGARSEDIKIEIVTKRHDQDGVDLRGAWVTVYKPHQEAVVERQYVPIQTPPAVIDSVPVDKISQSQDKRNFTIFIIMAIVVAIGLIPLAFLIARSKKSAIAPVEVNHEVAETPEPSNVQIERLNSIQFYDAEQPLMVNVVAEMQFDFNGVKLYVICDKKNANGEFKTFHLNIDNTLRFATSEKKWRDSVKNILRHWLNGTSEASDFSALEKAINKRLVTRMPN